MSFNLALAHLPHTSLSSLGPTGNPISFDEASSMMHPGASGVQHGPHVLVVDPTLQILAAPDIAEATGATIVGLSGVSDTYVLQALGEELRLRVLAEREVVEDQGAPLAAESVFDHEDDPEEAHFAIFCRIAGINMADLDRFTWTPIAAGSL